MERRRPKPPFRNSVCYTRSANSLARRGSSHCLRKRGIETKKADIEIRMGVGRLRENVLLRTPQYPRSPKVLLGGIAHLGRFIDKIRLRHAGQIQDYNYITTGFDKYLVEFLGIDAKAFEQRVLTGGTDEELLAWVKANGKQVTEAEIRLFSRNLLASGPKDEPAKQRFHGRLEDIAAKRGVPVGSLPHVSTWADVIELDEGRL